MSKQGRFAQRAGGGASRPKVPCRRWSGSVSVVIISHWRGAVR